MYKFCGGKVDTYFECWNAPGERLGDVFMQSAVCPKLRAQEKVVHRSCKETGEARPVLLGKCGVHH